MDEQFKIITKLQSSDDIEVIGDDNYAQIIGYEGGFFEFSSKLTWMEESDDMMGRYMRTVDQESVFHVSQIDRINIKNLGKSLWAINLTTNSSFFELDYVDYSDCKIDFEILKSFYMDWL